MRRTLNSMRRKLCFCVVLPFMRRKSGDANRPFSTSGSSTSKKKTKTSKQQRRQHERCNTTDHEQQHPDNRRPPVNISRPTNKGKDEEGKERESECCRTARSGELKTLARQKGRAPGSIRREERGRMCYGVWCLTGREREREEI